MTSRAQYRTKGGKQIPLTAAESASVETEWRANEVAAAAADAEQRAIDLGKWLERRERNARVLRLPSISREMRETIARLDARVDAEIAALNARRT